MRGSARFTAGSMADEARRMAAQAEGVLVSSAGLHLAYPTISVTSNGAAYIMYAYSGAGTLPITTLAPQFPGE